MLEARMTRAATGGLLALIALVAFSEYLSLNRIYQVDELEAVFTARLIAAGQASQFQVGAPLMVIGPMTWLAGLITRAAVLMRTERLLFLPIFWLNLCLIVRCAGLRLRSTRGLIALLLVATLAPLWDYGFEIRHDNLVLTAVLLAWIAARPLAPDGRRRLFVVGLLCTVAQFFAFKAFVYTLPVALFAFVAALWEERRSLWRTLGSLLAGAATGIAGVMLLQLVCGTWDSFALEMRSSGDIVSMVRPFSVIPTLARVPYQNPVFPLIVIVAIVYALRQARWRTLVSRDSLVPEAALFAGAFAGIVVNPTPFPYNLLLLLPQASILCLRLEPVALRLWHSDRLMRGLLSALVALHVVTWAIATQRHVQMSNARQADLMSTAEEMTDPAVHAVLDGTGLVPTRNPPNRYWLIHSFTVRYFSNGTYPSIRAQLAEGRTTVIIPNYQLLWLPREDWQFIGQHYITLAADFLVPGGILRGGGAHTWECLVPGRYYVQPESKSARVRIDGREMAAGPTVLSRGVHTFEGGEGALYLIWLGPRLVVPPALGPGDPRRVLVNWY